MKKINLVVILFTVCAITGFQCKKDFFLTGCLQGKVIDNYCADIIIQVTGGTYDPSLVIASWQDPASGITYSNVFAVENYCEIQKAGIMTGSDISFRIGGYATINDCITCLGIRPTPAKKNIIKLASCP